MDISNVESIMKTISEIDLDNMRRVGLSATRVRMGSMLTAYVAYIRREHGMEQLEKDAKELHDLIDSLVNTTRKHTQ